MAKSDELTPSTSMELVELALEDEERRKKREEQEMEDALWGEVDAADVGGAMEVDGEGEGGEFEREQVVEEEKPSFLPPTIDNDWECKRCYQVDSCMLYRKVSISLFLFSSSSLSLPLIELRSNRIETRPDLSPLPPPPSPLLRSLTRIQAIEQIEDDQSPIADLYEKKTGHLSVVHADFFRKWEELISFEEQDATRFASELWTMSAVEREKSGR